MSEQGPQNRYEREFPTGSIVKTTVCRFCAVGCGYRAMLVPENPESAEPATSGDKKIELTPAFISESMSNSINYKGNAYRASVVPDVRCDLNRGNHSVRGGSQGRNLVTLNGKDRSTSDRLVAPQVRCTDGKLHDIPWKVATELVARLTAKATDMNWERGSEGTHVLRAHQPERLGVKIFEYQYLENTFAATKLFYRAIGTPNVAYHDRPSAAGSSPGLKDAGYRPHAFSYEDIRHADVLFIIGSNPYENQSVFFMQNCVGKEIIVLDPRRTATAEYAVQTGGLHLQPKRLGADSLVIYAIARALLEVIPDSAIHPQVARVIDDAYRRNLAGDGNDPRNLRRASRALGLKGFREWLISSDTYTLANAAEVSGIELADLKRAVRILSTSVDESTAHPLVATLYEKGLIWGFNYHNTAAVGSLGLVLWQPGQDAPLAGRCGGHQKGWALAKEQVEDFAPLDEKAKENKAYPFAHSSDTYSDDLLQKLFSETLCDQEDDFIKVHHNLDHHVFGPDPVMVTKKKATKAANGRKRIKLKNGVSTVAEPDVNLLWIIGGNYLGQTNSARWKQDKIEERRRGGAKKPSLPKPGDLKDIKKLTKIFGERLREGLVVIHQEIYPNATTQFADIVLPASGWGEHDFIRYNAERRLRLYERFQDSPLHPEDQKRLKKKGEDSPLDPHDHLSNDGLLKFSPRPDWMIFRNVARSLIDFVTDKSPAARQAREEFDWKDSAAVADEMAASSNRTSILGDMLKYAKAHNIPEGQMMHTLLGRGEDGDAEYLTSQKGYLVPDGSSVLSNGVASNGVMLPAGTVVNGNEGGRTELHGTLKQRIRPGAMLNFVRADWCEISDWFEDFQPGDDEIALTCGRVNHLWNNMFSSVRNDFITERYPDDLPGTILEVNPQWAGQDRIDKRLEPFANGDIVEVKNPTGSFKAVISLQNSVANGAAFAIFSYPVHNRKVNGFTFEGYANNLMHGYWDGINPIGALKYANATIRKLPANRGGGNYDPGSASLFGQRNRIVTLPLSTDLRPGIGVDGRWSNGRRLDWRMRELIVAKGLPRAFIHSGTRRQLSLLDPDRAFEDIRNHWGAVFSMMLEAMQWPQPHLEDAGRYDRWDGADVDFVRNKWGRSLEIDADGNDTTVVPFSEEMLDRFIIWSNELTGFNDLGSDRAHASSILKRIFTREGFEERLRTRLELIDQGRADWNTQKETLVYGDAELAEVATLLWYTGAFFDSFGFPGVEDPQTGAGFGTMEDDHFRKALIWRAAEIQPAGYSTIMEDWQEDLSLEKEDPEP